MEILVYGLEQGQTKQYMESLLSTECKTDSDIQKIIVHAKKQGYHSFRVATYNGEKPNFIATIA
jgi:hypothetical protein